MSPKKKSLGRKSLEAKNKRQKRGAETVEQQEIRLQQMRERASTSRASEAEEQRKIRLQEMRESASTSRASEAEEQREIRLKKMRESASTSRASEAEEQHELRLQQMRDRASISRATENEEQRGNRLQTLRVRSSTSRAKETPQRYSERLDNNRLRLTRSRERIDLKLEAFNYDRDYDYRNHIDVAIGPMNKACVHCRSLKFAKESPGMCCSNGKVVLVPVMEPPEPLKSYLSGDTTFSKQFLMNIRNYNSCFQMTSFGATNIHNNAGYMPTFKVQGQIYHRIGSLLPLPNLEAKFLQIYFTGNEERETEQRCAINTATRREIISELQTMLHGSNSLIRLFKTAIDQMPSDDYAVVIRADKTPTGEHERRFNAPVIGDVAVVIVGTEFNRRDIFIHRRNTTVQRVSETHRSYDALQYPLLFPRGEDGYHFNIMQINANTNEESTKKVSCMDYYAYRIMIRANETNHILKCRELYHQFIVDMYAKIESERLLFIRLNQQKLRVEEYVHLRDAMVNDGNAANIGQMVVLPATYTGSPRQMHEYAQDAMTYVRKYGRPDLFITFTCNPTWSEITHLLFTGQNSSHRHDLLARVFKQKLIKLMDVITKNHIFGETRCWMYSVEWQKRGLPHAHILIWLKQKIVPSQIDSVITAELPNRDEDPILFETIKKHMIHGPCGALNTNSPCMRDGKCTKGYPRELINETQTGGDRYPMYRRRKPDDGGYTTTIRIRNVDVDIDNRWIVPYSSLLSKMFDAHINVEYCNSVKSIKYICKYVNKGSDMAVFGLANQTDEITQFQMGRYISSNEAVWRILAFNIHERYPTVQHLAVHLENGQRVYFTEQNAQNRAEQPLNTTLTAFFKLCASDDFAKTLLYHEVPKYYTWNTSTKKYARRKRGASVPEYADLRSSDALGRVYTVHPNNAECYYLRLLLHTVKGPTSFVALKTVDSVVCQTYREACFKLGLLENDRHWNTTLTEASLTCLPKQIRNLFAIILTTCAPSNPVELWETHRKSLSEDILRQRREIDPNQEYSNDIFNEALILIEDLCISINNKVLCQLGMPSSTRNRNDIQDRDLVRERQFDGSQQQHFVETQQRLLVADQKNAYDKVMQRVANGTGGIFFLDAPGGTGKTFLINLILASVRMRGGIALALASSGIASTLLDGGRTAHSALKLPLNLHQTETPTCNISKNSGMATILKTCKIIIWDECTMAHKKSLEALHRTLCDFREKTQTMGGALILLAGDFRQTLPVLPRSTPADELNACLKASYLWNQVEKITLSTNMRVHLRQDGSAQTFSKQLLDIGNGEIPIDRKTNDITFPPHFCQMQLSIQAVVDKVFPNLTSNYKNSDWLCERAILAPKNDDVNRLNEQIQLKLPGEPVKYKSIDTVMDEEQAVNYPTEFLNSMEPPGMPPHILTLKIGTPVMLIRNLNPPKLCNGTRLTVKKLTANLIEATIIIGKFKGEDVLIPRIPMITNDLPFDFKRLQFPLRLAFAITINKAQGQSLAKLDYIWKIHVFRMANYICCVLSSWRSKKFVHLYTNHNDQKYCLSASIKIKYKISH